mmetsp:Transcript_15352/g.53327  ORF Transcript_15352/g.53327 Transcript_15352/m.53327 type:complete len:229 (-) Transcript_15352:561-1247(-)
MRPRRPACVGGEHLVLHVGRGCAFVGCRRRRGRHRRCERRAPGTTIAVDRIVPGTMRRCSITGDRHCVRVSDGGRRRRSAAQRLVSHKLGRSGRFRPRRRGFRLWHRLRSNRTTHGVAGERSLWGRLVVAGLLCLSRIVGGHAVVVGALQVPARDGGSDSRRQPALAHANPRRQLQRRHVGAEPCHTAPRRRWRRDRALLSWYSPGHGRRGTRVSDSAPGRAGRLRVA